MEPAVMTDLPMAYSGDDEFSWTRRGHGPEPVIRLRYRRLKPYRAMKRAWDRITAQTPGLLPHWRWDRGLVLASHTARA
jgi:hypothetical protein